MNGPTNLDISDLVEIQEDINNLLTTVTPAGAPIFSVDLDLFGDGYIDGSRVNIGGLFSIFNRIDTPDNKAIDITNSIRRSVKRDLIEYHDVNGAIPAPTPVNPILEERLELYDADPRISYIPVDPWAAAISIAFTRKYARKNNIINYEE